MTDSETREILPEVQAYITAKGEAEKAYSASRDALYGKYPTYSIFGEQGREERRKYNEESNAAYTAKRIATNEAWQKLTQSSDPLVRWIAENAKEYQDQAVTILTALPATVEELEGIEELEDWCHIWGQFRDQAIAAGVMPGHTPRTPAFTAVLDGIDRVACCRLGTTDRRQVSRLLDALVAETKGEQVSA